MLCLGIGGGGDVVGTMAGAAAARELGARVELGGLTWERGPVDPLPGPRRITELDRAEPVHAYGALAGPDTTGPGGFRFAESHIASVTGRSCALIDPSGGPHGTAAAIAAVAQRLGCDLVMLLDVGGDVLAEGHEPGLASPLADAVLLAAAPLLRTAGLPVIACVFGAGCDGELTPTEVLARIAQLDAAGGMLGTAAPPERGLVDIERALPFVLTEASAMALRCARGERGIAPIRGGRRTVELSEAGGLLHWFDAERAMASVAPLASAVADATSLAQADEILRARGVRTELEFEVGVAATAQA
ncbi:unannotated protein [freshwater metagenome]|uniref:Unannotated protein n=1 Tax=freshwater metagenome TaxID=449393 RepID=A0A6J7INZ9_9ZZZZ